MRVFLTGSTGFIGSRLAAESLRRGHETHVLVRPTSDLERLPRGIQTKHVHRYDGTYASVRKALGESGAEMVMHLASLFLVNHSSDQVDPLISSNILFGVHLLEAMRSESVHSLINTGTTWQHYAGEDYDPANLYAATKKAFSDVLRYYVEAASLNAVTLELPDTFGPGDKRRKIINLLLESARAGVPLDLTPGDQFLDLVHVDDVVEAYFIAAAIVRSQASREDVYSLTSGRPLKLRDIVSLVENIAGRKCEFRLGARPYRSREVMDAWEKGVLLPGWRPSRTLESFLRDQLAEMASRSDALHD